MRPDRGLARRPSLHRARLPQLPAAHSRQQRPEVRRGTTRGTGETPAAPAGRDEQEEEEAKAKKGRGAAGARGRGQKDSRAAERARRTEQRKSVKVNNVVVQGGQVDMIEEQLGSRRG